MGWTSGTSALRILLASVALLLPAGVLSAAVLDPGPAVVTAAGPPTLSPGPTPSTAAVDTTTTTIAVATSTSTTSRVATTAVPTAAPQPSTPTPPPTAKGTTTTTVGPRTPIRTISTTPNLAPASSWQAARNGVSARMHIEPAAPTAGESILFVVDVSSADTCCLVFFGFDDGSPGGSNLAEACSGVDPIGPGSATFETTHTFSGPGAYRVTLLVEAGDKCPNAVPATKAGTPSVTIDACIAVGPGTSGLAGCRPVGSGPR